MTIERAQKGRPAVSIALVAALLGAAFATLAASTAKAAFSESESLGPNTVVAGVVDIDVGAETAVFRAENLAPGDRTRAQVTLRNTGTLPLNVSIVLESDGGSLGDHLASTVTAEVCSDTTPIEPAIALNQFGSDPALTGLVIAAGGSATICIGLVLPVDAPNDAQGTNVSFDVEFVAEQAIGLPEPSENEK